MKAGRLFFNWLPFCCTPLFFLSHPFISAIRYMHVWLAQAAPVKCIRRVVRYCRAIPAAYYLFMRNQKGLFFALLGFFCIRQGAPAEKLAC
ncbi:hypothetical protein EKL29_13175 [Pantoea sp. YU22]|uniref:hypothetical protein n=1 Tax=Pantoea piersonii TaxID=2364647 RepID=UPI000F9CD101|nr:hypothetical protein [Pantoea piersonii]RTY56982.1 hypothetical protein EKL29_13175 [Pantoea sp. YU22]